MWLLLNISSGVISTIKKTVLDLDSMNELFIRKLLDSWTNLNSSIRICFRITSDIFSVWFRFSPFIKKFITYLNPIEICSLEEQGYLL